MFLDEYLKHDFKNATEKVKSKTIAEVESAISTIYADRKPDFEDFLALVSPSADKYLEEIVKLSAEITRMRFGNTILLYMPLYLSNECRSSCTYCGYRYENKIPRKTLSLEEIRSEAKIIYDKGIRHILILTGEDYAKTSIDYMLAAVEVLKEYFVSISIEVYPLKTDEYIRMIEAGTEGLALYQETYDPAKYALYHKRGMKKNMEYRLNGPDRGGDAGFRKIGLGALLGLADPLGEMYFLGLHTAYILKNYWQTSVQISLPRIKSSVTEFSAIINVTDREFVRFVAAFRVYFKDVGIVLSTRESPSFRDNMLGLGITALSVESKTNPGGYSGKEELEQFSISDNRNIDILLKVLKKKGIDPVFKDFDRAIFS